MKRTELNEHQTEAIANADAFTSNAVLPTYTELLAALKVAHDILFERTTVASSDELVAIRKPLQLAGQL